MISRQPNALLVKFFLAFVFVFIGNQAYAQPGLDSPSPLVAYLNGAFPDTAPGSAQGDWVQVDYYPQLTFVEPVRVVEHPVENTLVVVGKDGKGWSVTHEQGATDKTLFFDISSIMHGKSGIGEGGISDLVFHPEFGQASSANADYVYITYRWSPGKEGVFDNSPTIDGYNRLSRFSVVNGQVDLNTELVLINQFDREQWHIGGDMFFGSDGFLYISAGDEGNCCNRLFSTQRLDGGLWSGILRIDVDQDPTRSHPIRRQPTHLEENPQSNGAQWPASYTQNYYIPNDNPFVDEGGNNLEEFYAHGLRHPWTISQDPETGNIWVADVGQASMEEINIIQKGGNYQWGYGEGTGPGVISKPANVIGDEVLPVFAYPRSEGQAVIGAGVYRGTKFPELLGKYLFSDFISGKFWATTPNGASFDTTQIGTVTAGFPNGINSYLLDSKGDILMAKTSGGLDPNGKIQMLARSADSIPTPEPPLLLSQTGAFSDLQNLVPHSGCIPYDLNVPFWSDAALKSRWLCMPNDGSHNASNEQIGFSENGDWVFPEGTVLIKHFELLTDRSDPNSNVRLETRFIVHGTDGYYGVTYRWDASGADAVLLTQSEEAVYSITTPEGSFDQTWHFPSRAECLTCHSRAAGGVLGPKTRQLNGDTYYPITGRTANQLETLNALGMFNPAIPQSGLQQFLDSTLTSTPTFDTEKSLAARARSYLDSNCSYCHRPGGVRANFDARLITPLSAQNIINGNLAESLGIDGEAVVVPGDLARSMIYHRASTAGESFSMPPLAKSLVDNAGVEVLEQWILALASFDIGNDTSTGGAFIDGHHPSLYINEEDLFVHDNEPGALFVKEFRFYAQGSGNPITPLVVKVNGDNDFTVLAIGTTRTESDYSLGENVFPFSDSGDVSVQLGAGDVVAIGFMDAFPDGTGWGAGTVIPAEAGSGANQDEIWGLLPTPLINQTSPYNPNRDTATVAVNQQITAANAGKALGEFNLSRSYKFAISFGLAAESGGPVEPPASLPLIQNGSFESPVVANWTAYSAANAIPGWMITSGSVEIDRAPWPAFDGDQSMDLSGNVPGSLEQTVADFIPGATYKLALEYGLHTGSQVAQNAEVLIDGQVVQTLTATTAMVPPAYQSASIEFIANDGQVTFGFNSLGSGSTGVVIDNVRVSFVSGGPDPVDSDGDGVPDSQDAFPNDPGETQDSDGDGVGDNADVFPNDASETQDSDGDGVGDNGDAFPNDASETQDTDGDGVGNNADAFPNDSTETQDSDADGVGDNSDAFPNDPTETLDSDGDGIGDNADPTPYGDQVPEFTNGSFESPVVANWTAYSAANAIPGWTITSGSVELDRTPWPAFDGEQSMDLNGNGPGSLEQTLSGFIPNATYTFELEYALHSFASSAQSANVLIDGQVVQTLTAPTSQKAPNYQSVSIEFTAPADGEVTFGFASLGGGGTGVVIDNLRIGFVGGGPDPVDSDGDGVPDSQDAFPNDPSETQDSDGDGVGDNADVFPNDASETQDSDGDGVGDNGDAFPNDASETQDTDGDGVGNNADAFPNDPTETRDSDADGVGDNSDAFPNDPTETLDSDGDGIGDNADPTPYGDQVPEFTNGSFESPVVANWTAYSAANAIPGWTITSGSVELDRTPWPAFDGEQSMDLNGNSPGSLEQALSGFIPNATYQFEFEYALHSFASSARSANVVIDGQVVQTLTAPTSQKAPNYQSVSIEFTAPADGEVTFGFASLGGGGTGVVIDNLRIVPSDGGGNGGGPVATSFCSSGQENLLVNGSFEQTSNANYGSTAEMIEAIGTLYAGGPSKFIDAHPDTDFPGWFTTGGIPLQQGGFSQGGTIEVGTDGFLGFNSPDGSVMVEMDGNHHNQIISVTPGQLFDWEFLHRGRNGVDTVSFSAGPVGQLSVLATVSSPNTAWTLHTGQYQVPDDVDEIQIALTPVAASDGDIDSSHLLDDVKFCVAN